MIYCTNGLPIFPSGSNVDYKVKQSTGANGTDSFYHFSQTVDRIVKREANVSIHDMPFLFDVSLIEWFDEGAHPYDAALYFLGQMIRTGTA